MFWVVHGDHRAEEFVQFDRQVANVRALAATEQRCVAADMPDVVVAGKCSVSTTGRERGIFHDEFIEKLKRRLVAQCLEGTFTPVAGHSPELWCGKVDIGKWHNR